MTTKHNQIIRYIESLAVGERISVRSLAKKLEMSEGTVYRAIKAAEQEGLVSTIERVGTIRIEQKDKISLDQLSFREVMTMTEGKVIGGAEGLDKSLNKFIIGAMEEDAVIHYLTAGSLLLVGNRENIQKLALEHGVAVLITGGFNTSQDIIDLANESDLPIIRTSYDTFSVATMINQSMADRQIREEILMVEDIYEAVNDYNYLEPEDTVASFYELSNITGLSRFPVAYNKRLVGVVTAKDLIGRPKTTPIERVMTKKVVTAKLHMSLANVSYQMVWEDIEMIPVVADNLELIGSVSRQDVMKALHNAQQLSKLNYTFEDQVLVGLKEIDSKHSDYLYCAVVEAQMINHLGNVSYGVLCEWIGSVSQRFVLETIGQNCIIEKIDLHYFSNIQIGNEIYFKVDLFNQNRRNALMQVDVYYENRLVAKTIITSQLIERN